MYYTGQGILKDTVNAYAWLNVASANGEELASEARDDNAKGMTPEQIAEAQKLSKVWFEKYQPKE
jgi:TPR repeat protein